MMMGASGQLDLKLTRVIFIIVVVVTAIIIIIIGIAIRFLPARDERRCDTTASRPPIYSTIVHLELSFARKTKTSFWVLATPKQRCSLHFICGFFTEPVRSRHHSDQAACSSSRPVLRIGACQLNVCLQFCLLLLGYDWTQTGLEHLGDIRSFQSFLYTPTPRWARAICNPI